MVSKLPRSRTTLLQVKHSLAPYLQLTQAVKTGDVGRSNLFINISLGNFPNRNLRLELQSNQSRFDSVVKKFAAQFQADFTYSLIVRLHHNVVKTAVII